MFWNYCDLNKYVHLITKAMCVLVVRNIFKIYKTNERRSVKYNSDEES